MNSICLNLSFGFACFVGTIEPGLPDFKIPPFSINDGNTTLTFVDIMKDAGAGIIILPLISILENLAIGSAFAGGKTIDATQVIELF